MEATIPEDVVNDPPAIDEVVAPEGGPANPSGPPDQSFILIPTKNTTSSSKHADKPSAPVQTGEGKDDEVIITGEGRTEPGNPIALAKHTAKEELSALNKGKWDVDLATYSALNAQDVHSGYLNRLYTSRDYEANLVKMMKDKLEVISMPSFLLLTTVAPRVGLTLA